MGEARKTVTIVFSDVVGSTRMGEQVDPEALRRVMERYFVEMRAVLERHGGTVEKFIGDAVMAVFGIPTTHEDDALRAVRAASEMRERLAVLNEELERERGVSLAVRTGVNTGAVVAGDPASGQFYATGDAVNVAARLEQVAEPGQVLLGEHTYRLVQSAVEVEALAPFALKGKTKTVSAYLLHNVIEGAPAFARRFDTPFVGRQEELASLFDCFERSTVGRAPVLVTVLGPAGIGKTRLAAELAAVLQNRATVLRGRCLSYGEGITFWPLQEILRSLPGRPAGAPDPEHAHGTEEIFWAYRKLFEALARERPHVLVLEDIHWAEPTLLDLVEHLVEWTRDAPLLILCLARLEILEQRPAWPGERLDLEPLPKEESEAIITALIPDLGLASRIRAARVAEGNPLFLEQLLALNAEEEIGEGELPDTIQALLAARLDRLEASERALLGAASVIGREFWRGALLRLSPPETEVSALLQGLVRKRLIHAERSSFPGDDAFRFSHILIREVTYGGLPKGTRSELHEQFASWLEESASPYDEIVGYHLEQAHRYRAALAPADEQLQALGDRGSRVLERAGLHALGRGDCAAAANLLQRARALSSPDDPRVLFLAVLLGDALELLGQLEQADVLYQETMYAAETVGDPRTHWLALLNHVWLSAQIDPTSWAAEEVRQTAARAIHVFGELDDDFGLARAWKLSGQVDWNLCRYDFAREADERALFYARRAGDENMVKHGVNSLMAGLRLGATPAAEAIERIEALMEQVAGNRPLEANALFLLAALRAMQGAFEEARAQYHEAKGIVEDMGLVYLTAARALHTEEVGLLAGDAEFAERELRAGYEILEAIGEQGVRSTMAAHLAEALFMLGRFSEAERFAEVAVQIASPDDVASQAWGRTVKARLLAERGDHAAGDRLAREAVRLGANTDDLFMKSQLLMGLADVLRRSGRDDEAIPVLQEAAEVSERKGNAVTAAKARAQLAELGAGATA
jgi:class 3 adenylate cyclase/tetratricopeptide (TPR) repeat protein